MCSSYGINNTIIYPNSDVEVYLIYNNKLCKTTSHWGIPLYDKLVIHARSETLEEKKLFSGLTHCIIKSDSFIEWDESHYKVEFTRIDEEPLYMAGLIDLENHNHVIITTSPNESVINIHDRMPLILEKNQLKNWLTSYNSNNILLSRPKLLKVNRELEQLSLF